MMYSSQATALIMSLFSGKEQLPLQTGVSSDQVPLHVTTNSAGQDDVNNAYEYVNTIKHVPCGDKTELGAKPDGGVTVHVHMEMEEEENAYEI